jgi:outer membrane protein assembly complex protein YaeT
MGAKDRIITPAVRAGVLLVMLLFGTAALAQSPAGKVLVGDIIVRGNQRTSTERITGMLKTRVGGEYVPEVVQEDVRRLMASRLFGNVQARYDDRPDGKVTVYFIIVDYPSVVEEVVYNGAKHVKKEDLETATGIRTGAPLNPLANKLACQAIERLYQEKGRPFSTCALQEGSQSGDKRVIFNICEGPEVYVRDIEFDGNTFVSGGVLRTHLNTSTTFLRSTIFAQPYTPLVIDHDVDKLKEYYRSFGFHDVQVTREVKWDTDSRTVVLVFHLNEGVRYRIKSAPQINEANGAFPREEIERLAYVKEGEFYDQAKIDKDVNTIKDYIGRTGREAKVQHSVFFTAPGECSVHYDVNPRPPAKVGQILVVGNEVTRQNVILREVPLFPGQLLSYPELRVAERNLARLNIFEMNPDSGVRPTVTVLDPDSDSEFKDVLVNVQETRTGSLLFGLGVNSDAGLTGSIVLNERNFDITRYPTSFDDLLSGHAFRGGGQELRMEAVPGTQLQRYTISFREPHLFDSQFNLGLSGYYYQRQFDEYLESRVGFQANIGRKISDNWSVTGGVRVEEVGVHDVSIFAPPIYQEAVGNNFQVGVRGGVVYDTRDSYLRPTEGSRVDVTFEEMFGDFSFPLLTIDANQYFTVWQRADGSGRHVLAVHSQVSWAGENTPVYERYFAGGFRSLRGFAFRGVGPNVNGFMTGGDFMFLNSLEYQVPLRANDSIYAVGFIDSGTVENSTEIRDYRVSAGFGLRFVVPMLGPVPIALDFGFPIVKAPSDHQQLFSFWLGFFR